MTEGRGEKFVSLGESSRGIIWVQSRDTRFGAAAAPTLSGARACAHRFHGDVRLCLVGQQQQHQQRRRSIPAAEAAAPSDRLGQLVMCCLQAERVFPASSESDDESCSLELRFSRQPPANRMHHWGSSAGSSPQYEDENDPFPCLHSVMTRALGPGRRSFSSSIVADLASVSGPERTVGLKYCISN